MEEHINSQLSTPKTSKSLMPNSWSNSFTNFSRWKYHHIRNNRSKGAVRSSHPFLQYHVHHLRILARNKGQWSISNVHSQGKTLGISAWWVIETWRQLTCQDLMLNTVLDSNHNDSFISKRETDYLHWSIIQLQTHSAYRQQYRKEERGQVRILVGKVTVVFKVIEVANKGICLFN